MDLVYRMLNQYEVDDYLSLLYSGRGVHTGNRYLEVLNKIRNVMSSY